MIRLLLIALLAPVSLCAQLQLVTDFNTGAEDGFDCFQCQGQPTATLAPGIITVATTLEAGRELALLADGQLSLLKDINPGANDGRIDNLVKHEGLVYFSAADPANGGAVWVTDGTESGTILFFDPDPEQSSSFIRVTEFAFGADGALYVVFGATLYRYANDVATELADNVFVSTPNDNFPGGSFTTYGDGIAYVSNESPNFGQGGGLYQATDTLRLLGIIEDQSRFDQAYGLRSVNGNLLFALQSSSDDRRGTWAYATAADTFFRYEVEGISVFQVSRWYDVNDSLTLGLIGSDFYALDGINTPVLFYEADGLVTAARQEYPAVQVGGQLMWQSGGGVFGTEQLSVTDGTSAGTEVVLEDDFSAGFTNLLEAGGYVFFAENNGSRGPIVFYRFDPLTRELTEIYEAPVRADNRAYDIQLLGVRDSLLYLAADADEDIGRELYSLELDVDIVSTPHLTRLPELTVNMTAETYFVEAEGPGMVDVAVFDLSGRLLERGSVPVNSVQQLTPYSGLRVYVFTYQQRTGVRRVPGRR